MKILIADDEALVRQSVILFLLDLGIEKEDITEVNDGFLLLDAMKQHHFDLALVDIRMPGMDGLKALKSAGQFVEKANIYILSGFDDFKYAQEAIRIGVKDYMLKPINRQNLKHILEQTIAEMEQQRALLTEKLKIDTAAMLNTPEHAPAFSQDCYPVLIADDNPSLPFSVSMVSAQDHDKLIVIPHRIRQMVLLFTFEIPEYSGYYKVFLNDLIQRHTLSHTLIEGRRFRDSSRWSGDYQRMLQLAALRSVYGSRCFYPAACKVPEDASAFLLICSICEQCLDAYSKSDYVKFTVSCDLFLKNIKELQQTHPQKATRITHYLQSAFALEHHSFAEIRDGLNFIAASFTVTAKDFHFEEVINYINSHYTENLCLTDLAYRYGLSSNYFSTIFKKKTGSTFIHYLTSLRIAESERLLRETSLTIREISEHVGYYSTSFFIRTFKKIKGITPSEYRRTN